MWTPRRMKDVPSGAKFITSTWAMKKKTNGTYRARLNVRGFQKVEGVHYYAADIASPVTNDMSIRIVMVLTLMAGLIAKIVDVKGEFCMGNSLKELSQCIWLSLKNFKSTTTIRWYCCF